MFILSLSRIISFSFRNFVRNIWLSIVTITIIVLTLFSVTSLVFINATLDQAIGLVKSKIDVSVYFKPTVSEEQVFFVKDGIESLDYVKEVKYVSKSEALEKLRAQYNNSPLILESLKEIDNNPLGDTLIVGTFETADYQKVIDFLNATPEYSALIENKSFEDNEFIIERLEELSAKISGIGWVITAFFALVAILVIVNTIRIAIYTHEQEIRIMKLVGASNWFVRGPFIGEAILLAILGSIITIGLAYLFANFGDPYVRAVLGSVDFSLLGYLNSNFIKIFGLEMIGIVVVSVFSTFVALGRYLKV
jgi:cell division transport system permease protein